MIMQTFYPSEHRQFHHKQIQRVTLNFLKKFEKEKFVQLLFSCSNYKKRYILEAFLASGFIFQTRKDFFQWYDHTTISSFPEARSVIFTNDFYWNSRICLFRCFLIYLAQANGSLLIEHYDTCMINFLNVFGAMGLMKFNQISDTNMIEVKWNGELKVFCYQHIVICATMWKRLDLLPINLQNMWFSIDNIYFERQSPFREALLIINLNENGNEETENKTKLNQLNTSDEFSNSDEIDLHSSELLLLNDDSNCDSLIPVQELNIDEFIG